MKSNVCIFILVLFVCFGCSTVPLTGRKQLDIVPTTTMLSMSYQQHDEFLKSHELSGNVTESRRVKIVGQKIQHAVERYMAENTISQRLEGYQWEFNLVKSDEVNAWCMPGGKVVVYTGILPITKDENGLAVVMSHEIAHAVAKHGDERLSQQLLAQLGESAFSVALEKQPAKTRELWMNAFGIGLQAGVLLPYSRVHESEADHLGLIFMAMAGYDPHAAVDFWKRMGKAGGQKPPEFLSTHPSDERRIRDIEAELPEAMTYYKQ